MRRSTVWRALIALSVAIPLTIHAQALSTAGQAAGGTTAITSQVHQGGLSPAEVQRLSHDATQRVIVLLRDQHQNLTMGAATRASRLAAIDRDQAPLLAELAQVHALRVRPFHIINGIAAVVSAAEAAHLAANPAVRAVLPDAVIRGPQIPQYTLRAVPRARPSSALPPCEFKVELDPQALQLTRTAYRDADTPQAQNIVTGTGVTVAFLADGVNPNNPDFIRPDGTSVFSDYQDFSGDGPFAPTGGAEAFLDASSIAAQGSVIHDVNNFINVAHKRSVDCPNIRIVGVAPGASLMGLKVFGQANTSFNSNFVQAIEYAVSHGANVINESFGSNPFPDTNNDPITLADNAAVAAGVTVVVSTGDAGTAGTIGSPSSDPNVISAGATTQFRIYAQIYEAGIQLGNMTYVDNNISSFSSAGPSQSGQSGVDVVAPGDLGWAVCDANTAIYTQCTDLNGMPSDFQVQGGTSESSPLTAGEAALVIQAYRESHGGATPSPQLVKQIIMSTAADLGVPSYEQGAGLIDTYKAVRAAMSYNNSTRFGWGLLVSPNTLTATDQPNTAESFPVQVTNTGAVAQTIKPTVETLGAPNPIGTFTVNLDPINDPTFVDAFGSLRSYAEQDFSVPAGMQRLDASIAWNIITQTSSSPVRLSLFDGQGRFVAFSNPQDLGAPLPNSGYGHVDVRNPAPGTWRAIIWTHQGTGYSGPVQLSVSTSNFVSAGSVTPASLTLAPGQSSSFTVHVDTPAQPGDESANVSLNAVTADGTAHLSGAIPVILRSLIPTGPTGGTWHGTLTGGNGRFGSPGQTQTYQFDVPSGLKDLDLNTSITDTNYNLEGVLVDPNGMPLDVQSTVTSLNSSGMPATYTNTLQFFRRDPQAGRWEFVFFINDNSGPQTSIPFTGTITFNGVSVSTTGVPNSAGTVIPSGSSVTAQIVVTNTGNTTKDFFVDHRLSTYAPMSLGGLTVPLPVPSSLPLPAFFVPPESTQLTIAAESMTPTVPISMDIYNINGAPPFGGTGTPDIEAMSFVDPFTGNYSAVATSNAPEVVPGLWNEGPTEVGPYPNGATPSSVQLGATAVTQQFDNNVHPDTGDAYAVLAGIPGSLYTPATLAPGASHTINVTFGPPSAPKGTVVSGTLYVDALNANSTSVGLITGSGDELIAIPYTYTVG